jgi:sigma-B regulation protein RsbU (phosphoserine phosphatase)
MVARAFNPHQGTVSDEIASALAQRQELDEARKVQEQLLPRELPSIPGWDIAAACRPARVVSGDYCDVFGLGNGQIAFALGDVSGKGLGPALVMAGLRASVRARLTHPKVNLASLMRELNVYLLSTTPDEMFVRLFLAILDTSTGQVRHVNAGHIPPLVLAGSGAAPMRFTISGSVLGVLPDAVYEELHVGLRPESLLAVFSDGIVEAMNAAGKMFNERRVVDSLRQGWGKSAIQTMAHLLENVDRFAQGSPQADDISVILFRHANGPDN